MFTCINYLHLCLSFFMCCRQISYNIELFKSHLKYDFQSLSMSAIISLFHQKIYHYKVTVLHY